MESNGEVMKDPSLTGRMGSARSADASKFTALSKRFIWALMMLSRDKPFKQGLSVEEQAICELKKFCKVCCVEDERNPKFCSRTHGQLKNFHHKNVDLPLDRTGGYQTGITMTLMVLQVKP